ncbi:hypothetical protein [Frankia sp. AgB32]|uniref:hypothetical protein n=1 Tax=Frankia sp. AgB32 TaxID=631119 RepID=UPI00200F1564|nr:hypothetical protein [Frankia sp. AgB32]MCK9897236.1 hypothetical protein [Frankia sp. AgB32]
MRRRAATPPGRLRLVSIGLVVAIVLLWLTAFATTVARQHAVDVVRGTAGPGFLAAQRVHADLSEADASAAAAFLAGGVEPVAQRRAYQHSLAQASTQVLTLARARGTASTQDELTTLASQIPVYSGLVDQARADNRLGFAVGGAYLRQASTLMQTVILPAADRLAAAEADRIDDGYRRATYWWQPVLVTLTGLLALGGLVVAQVVLARRTHRYLNVALVAATVVTAVAFGLTLSALSAQRSRLLDGRDGGFVPMTLVAQARVLALRAWGDSSLSLIAHGDGADQDSDAIAASARLGYDRSGHAIGSGVLPAAARLGGPDAATRAPLPGYWAAYATTAARIRFDAADLGGFQNAVGLALGDGTTAFRRFDTAADTALATSQRRFDTRLTSADDALGGLAAEVSVALALAVVGILAGYQARINDFR